MLPWQMAARMTGAKLVYLECEKDGTLTDETLKAGINENTKIVAVGQVSNVLGCVNPVKKIAAMAHAVGAVMVVDAAQSAPAYEDGCQGFGCRFYCIQDISLWDLWV